MASVVQSKTVAGTVNNVTSVTFDATPAIGSRIVAVTHHRGTKDAVSITSAGTWTQDLLVLTDITNATNRRGLAFFSSVYESGDPTTITVTWTGGSNTSVSLIIYELDLGAGGGLVGPTAFDEDPIGTTVTSQTTGTTAATTVADAVAIAATVHKHGISGPEVTYDNGFGSPIVEQQGTSSGSLSATTGHKVLTATGTVTSTASWTQTALTTGAVVVYTEPAGATTLVVEDAFHAHTADAVVLTQVHTLVGASDAFHSHTADNAVLTQVHTLVVEDAFHAHTADAAGALTQAHNITVADAFHGHTADNAVLTQVHALIAADAFHAHTADNVTLGLPGGTAWSDLAPTWATVGPTWTGIFAGVGEGSGDVTGIGIVEGVGQTNKAGAADVVGIGAVEGTGAIDTAGAGDVTGIGRLEADGDAGFLPPLTFTAIAISLTRIDLAWSAADDAEYYEVERERWNGASWVESEVIPYLEGLAYSDTGVAGLEAYRYRIRAVGP